MAAAKCPDCGSVQSREPWADGLCPHCLIRLAESSAANSDQPGDQLSELPTAEFPEGSLAPGRVFGNRYEIRARLGRGGMGEVWRAFDLKLRVDVALKAMHPKIFEGRGPEMLRREVRSAREVNSPNVCRVYDLIEVENSELISMEFVDGTTLRSVIDSRAPLDLGEAREIALQFLAGLEAIHLAGLVHRDVKPENIMITRSGRVVLMDFGIAKGMTEKAGATIAGTPAYMPLEQLHGEMIDPRADVFAAGVVLLEMVAPNGGGSTQARQNLWHGVRQQPPELPDSPWTPVLRKAVAREARDRFTTASALARALEDITQRVTDEDKVQPYPGLAAFTEESCEFFFGREMEVEQMWKKLDRPRLLGLIGPSGAGKTSFIRAGLIPAMPADWSAIIAKPGNRPIVHLAQALVPKLSGDSEALGELPRFEEVDVAIAVFSSWRSHHKHGVVIIDQFEETFTLNPPEVQERFAALLGRLPIEADVHVLLSMRDDFLARCHDHEPLRPLLSDLTLLGAPSGAALRRAVMEPALRCGYRFEDEELVAEILREVENERGALPMLAFAAARLWERRDREEGLLTRTAYEEIGGVGGALAQHAEQTLERLGTDRVPYVRELLRNLITSQGTRSVMDREEILSVFDLQQADTQPSTSSFDRVIAAEVLDSLIDARLLTTYDVNPDESDGVREQRIEIVHESLLSAWPRLVRWQTQDADGVQLRDQLRQAARLWTDRGKPDDLLWTGTSFKEFELWRERYAGGLSSSEEAFASAMRSKSHARKRRKQIAFSAVVVVLLAIAATVTGLWRRSENQRERAVAAEEASRLEARRAEANQLITLGRLALDENPSAAVAYTAASLDLADTTTARHFALEALQRGHTAFVLGRGLYWQPLFSPDGRWLAIGGNKGKLEVWSRNGGDPARLEAHGGNVLPLAFLSDPDRLVSSGKRVDNTLRIWSLDQKALLETQPIDNIDTFDSFLDPSRNRVITMETSPDWSRIRWRAWPLSGGPPELLLDEDMHLFTPWCLSPTSSEFGYGGHTSADDFGGFFVTEILDRGFRSATRLLDDSFRARSCAFDAWGRRLAASAEDGTIIVWNEDREVERVFRSRSGAGVRGVAFSRDGSYLAGGSGDGTLQIWDLYGPPDARPQELRWGPRGIFTDVSFAPGGSWIASTGLEGAVLWPVAMKFPHVLPGHSSRINDLEFSDDGKWLVSASYDGTIVRWPLSPKTAREREVVVRVNQVETLEINPYANLFLYSDPNGGLYLEGSNIETTWLKGMVFSFWGLALDPTGKMVAAGGGGTKTEDARIRLWSLEKKPTQGMEPSRTLDAGDEAPILDLAFSEPGKLVSAGRGGIRIWSIDAGKYDEVFSEPVARLAMNRAGERLIARLGGDAMGSGPAMVLDLKTGAPRQLASHGQTLTGVAMDPEGKIVVTGDTDGIIRVAPFDGSVEPHLLIGHVGSISALEVSPDGRWIASGGSDNSIRLWPMPDVSKPPLQAQGLEQILSLLHSLTNLRAVRDASESTGWKIETVPIPSWQTAPTW